MTTLIVAAAEGGGGSPVLIAALASGGLGAILAAIVAGVFSKRKLGAEATEIITKAAAGVVTNMEGDLTRMRSERAIERAEHEAAMILVQSKVAQMAADHAAEREDWKRVLQLHVAWDAIAIAKLADLDVVLPPAPPLLPRRD